MFKFKANEQGDLQWKHSKKTPLGGVFFMVGFGFFSVQPCFSRLCVLKGWSYLQFWLQHQVIKTEPQPKPDLIQEPNIDCV